MEALFFNVSSSSALWVLRVVVGLADGATAGGSSSSHHNETVG